VWNANAYADCFANSDSYIHSYSNSYRNPQCHANRYSNSYWNTQRYADRYINSYRNTQLDTNRYRKPYSDKANTNTETCSDRGYAAYSTSSLDPCAVSDVATTYSSAAPISERLKLLNRRAVQRSDQLTRFPSVPNCVSILAVIANPASHN